MFINCGGFIDLTEKWFVTRQNNAAKIILFDANKPLHHQNIESNQVSQFLFFLDFGHRWLAQLIRQKSDFLGHE